MKNIFFLFLLFPSIITSQSLTGKVLDSLGIPLQNANIIAKPQNQEASLRYAIADHQGRYKLQLEKEIVYEIRVSYLGYMPKTIAYDPENPMTQFDFILIPSQEQLKEVIITHKYEPIIVKKDTVSYKVDAFASGNERKLKEQLEKLPGVEVDKDGSVTFQGKRVNTLLVENKTFFGGGTKLGVENIPADAVDKVEFIDHFNEVAFMKEVSDSDKLAMNIKLKEDKKKFVFGDLVAGYGLNNFYLGHASLFYYSEKLNLGYIGDANNFGERVFSFDDLMRFQGGVSSFLNTRKSLSNLYGFTMNNNDVVKTQSQFHALNVNYSFTPKLDLQGFLLFSDILRNTQSKTKLQYIQVETEENRRYNSENKTTLGMTNWKLDYSPNRNTKWFYNVHGEWSANDFSSLLQSQQFNQTNTFESLRDADNVALKQYVERHQSHNKKNTTTLVINHVYQVDKPQTTWLTNQPFLSGLIPLQEDDTYKIKQLNRTATNTVDALFKHYYLWNSFNHLYSVAGFNYENTELITSEKQFLTDGTVNDFSENGFQNRLRYQLQDYYAGIEYKFKWGNVMNKPMLYHHWYIMTNNQELANQRLHRSFFEPQWLTEWEPNNAEKLTFNYRLTNQFPQAAMMTERFTLQNFNAVFRGNALLENERFHFYNVRYNKNNMYRGWMLFANAAYTRRSKTIRNTIEIQGIDQLTTPIQTGNPETNWNVSGSVSKKIYRFNLRLNASISGFEYVQEVNGVEALNQRNNQRFGFNLRTVHKNWPSIALGYQHGFSQFVGVQNNSFQNQTFDASFDYEIFKHVVFKSDYQWNNAQFATGNNIINLWNASLFYQKKNSPFGFELKANNLLDIDRRFQNSFSDFIISEQEVFILPRVVLFTLHYKI